MLIEPEGLHACTPQWLLGDTSRLWGPLIRRGER